MSISHESKVYEAPKQNPALVAPWHGVNFKNPTQHDIVSEIAEDKKIDISQTEVKSALEVVEEQEMKQEISERQPRVIEALLILFASMWIIKMFVGNNVQQQQ